MENGFNEEDYATFKGSGGELFSIWIVNILLTIVTFGIYSAWAKVRIRKYLLVMTEYRDERFDYHARPWPILKGRIVVLILFSVYAGCAAISPYTGVIGIILIALAFPYLLLKSFQFNVHYTSYRNVRFRLEVDYKKEIKAYFLRALPIIISVGVSLIIAPVERMKGQELGVNDYIALGLFAVNALYTALYFGPFFLNWLYSNLYGNLYYGNIKFSFDSSIKEVWKKIVLPYSGLVVGMLALLFGGAFFGAFLNNFLITGIGMALFYLSLIAASLYFPFLVQHYIWNRIACGAGRASFSLTFGRYFRVNFVNFILMGLTLGLYFPFAKVRVLKLLYQHRALSLTSLDDVVQVEVSSQSAVADEVSDAFDIDFEIGI